MKLPGVTRVLAPVIHGRMLHRTLFIDSDYLAQCAELWRTGEYTHLGLESYQDAFKLGSVDFLDDFPPVQRLTVTLERRIDLSALARHAGRLEEFRSNDELNFVEDLTPFTKLTNLAMKWDRSVRLPDTLPTLQQLGLTHFCPKSENLTSLPGAPGLQRLALRGAFQSLDGIERYTQLTDLSLYKVPKLADVHAMSKLQHLQAVEFDLCKGPFALSQAFQPGAPVVDLKYLSSTELPDVQFVRQLPKLEKFVFMHTPVTDGDMTPLLEHPALSYVSFTDTKHFSHKWREVNQAIGQGKSGT